MTEEQALERLNKMADWLEKFIDPDQPNREENLKDFECILIAIEAMKERINA